MQMQAGNSQISAEEKKEERRGWDELTGVNLGPVDPATLQATKIACAHPPSLSFSGLVSNFRRTGIIVRGMFGERSARRMSPSARHKQSLVQQDRNPGFRSGNLHFLRGEEIFSYIGLWTM